jgi:spermidine synthase
MSLNDQWFTEIAENAGTAFSLKIHSKLHEEQTPYQKIAIYDTEQFGKLMVIDGCTMLSTRDNFLYHEMMSHPALYTHQKPAKVVIIGGGDCGTLQAVLQHTEVEQAWQIDIDERVTRLSEQYFPELCTANNDERAHLLFADGIQWMKDADTDSIDVIIVDSTDPVGPAEGLFSEAFFRDCLKALRPDGIIVQQSESPLLHMDIIKNMHTSMRKAGFVFTRTLSFPQCIYPSGWWSCTMASKENTLDKIREEDINKREFETRYYNEDIHIAAMALPEFMKAQLD